MQNNTRWTPDRKGHSSQSNNRKLPANTSLPKLVDAFARQKVLVIGEAMLDSYLEGSAGRICREAPVPVVDVESRKDAPGGAANTAVNLCQLGGKVTFLSVTGADMEGTILRKVLEEKGVSTRHIFTDPERQTLAKHRVIADNHLLVRFDQGTTGPVRHEIEEQLVDCLYELFPLCDALVISDYGYGILTPRIIEVITDLQARMPRVVVADSKDLTAYRNVGITACKPNYGETINLLGIGNTEAATNAVSARSRAELIAGYEEDLFELTGAQIAAVTLDREGALIFERGNQPHRTYAHPTANSRATGAGDTFVSTLTLALATGAQTPAAAELASAACAIVVESDGTVPCSAAELKAFFNAGDKQLTDLSRLSSQLEHYRRQGCRLVFTNGIFDLLHPGHIAFLNRAKTLGDVLIVGVNSDESVRRLKGEGRPINCLEDRVQVLSALSCIDHIIAFDADRPEELIEAIRPDVFVKGGDYTRGSLPEAVLVEELGGEVQILPYVPDLSTSSIIERIRQAYPRPGYAANPVLDDGASAVA